MATTKIEYCACDNEFACAFNRPENKKLKGNCFHLCNDLNRRKVKCRIRKGSVKLCTLLKWSLEKLKPVKVYRGGKDSIMTVTVTDSAPELLDINGDIYKISRAYGPIQNDCYIFVSKAFKPIDLNS